MNPPERLRVASYNVHRCIGNDGLRRPRRIAEVLRRLEADVIALQEIDTRLDPRGLPTQLEILAEALDARAVAGPTMEHFDGFYGNAVLVRGRLARARLRENLHDLSVAQREPRGAIDLHVDWPDASRSLRVIATHLGLRPFERREQTRALVSLVRQQPASPATATVVLGDFNEWWPLSRVLGRLRRDLGPSPRLRSWPAWRPLLALDRIWVRPRGVLRAAGVRSSTLTAVASDHLPIWADLTIPAGSQACARELGCHGDGTR